jgi:hypothetical protein
MRKVTMALLATATLWAAPATGMDHLTAEELLAQAATPVDRWAETHGAWLDEAFAWGEGRPAFLSFGTIAHCMALDGVPLRYHAEQFGPNAAWWREALLAEAPDEETAGRWTYQLALAHIEWWQRYQQQLNENENRAANSAREDRALALSIASDMSMGILCTRLRSVIQELWSLKAEKAE